MSNLKRLGATIVMTFVLGVSTLADETNTPTCVPGEMHTPPCASLLFENVADPGQIDTPPAPDSVDIMLLAEIALDSLLIF